MRIGRGWIAVGAAAMLAAIPAGGAGAGPATEVAVASATLGSSTVTVTGSLTLGDDARGPVEIIDDSQGDSTVSGAGLDFGKVTVTADPVAQRLTFRINTYDMPPVADQTAPFYGYLLPFMVDENDAPKLYLATGNVGANFPPATGRFWALCNTAAGSYTCPTTLTGTMGGNLITIQLPYSRAAIKPGSIIQPGGANAGCPGLCSTIWAVFLFGNTGGDSAFFDGFEVPGSVKLGIAPEGTPTQEIELTGTASVAANGTWTGSLARPGPGTYTVVARSCFGSIETPICAEATSTITV